MNTTLSYFKYLLIVCATVFSFAACSSDDDDNSGSNATIDIISPADKQITCTGKDNNDVQITFSASNDWTAISSHKWISLSKMTGSAGDNSIIVSIEDNDAYKTRIGTITIKDKVSGKSSDITVTQGEKDGVLTFSTESQTGTSLVIDNENQTITAEVNVKSNYDYTMTISPDWLSYENKGRNDDGSVKYVFHADVEKLYAAGGYNEQTAIVSFAYQAETRAPATKEYAVKFEGVTSFVTFYSDEESVTSTTLIDENGEGVYKSIIKVKSNIAWSLKNSSDYSDVEVIGNDQSVKFFETIISVGIELKDGFLDTDDLTTGKIEVVDANTNKTVNSLSVIVNGVGQDYIYIDQTSFIEAGKDQMTGVYMFAADGGEMPFSVKASDIDNVAFYLAKVETSLGVPTIIKSVDVTAGWPAYGGVDEAPKNRSAIGTGRYVIWTSERSEMESMGGGDPSASRFFALFAVSKADYPDFDSMFNIIDDDWENGTLKEGLENSYIILGQKGMEINYTFDSEQVPYDGVILTVPAEGGEIKISYETNNENISLYKDVKWDDKEDPYDWSGDYFDNTDLSVSFPEQGVMVLKVSETKTSRSFSCGIAAYVENKERDYMMRTFTIRQTIN